MPVDSIPLSSKTIWVKLKTGRSRGKLDHQVVRLPAGTPAANLLLKVLGVAGPASGRSHEVEGLEAPRCGLLRKTLNSRGGGWVPASSPLAYPTAASVENLEEPT
jgi:hypothetical protein